jgi:hypothetical protein
MAASVTICDVGPRDGLQNESSFLEPSVRAELVNRLAETGLPRIEAASFVHPDRVPQMAGAEEVSAAIDRRDGVVYAGLVLNEKGYERLATSGLDEVHYSFGATESFNRRNANTSVEDSLAAPNGSPPEPEPTGCRSSSRSASPSAVPSKAASRRSACWSWPSASSQPVRTRSSSPTRSAWRFRARFAIWSPRAPASVVASASTCRTRGTRALRTPTRPFRRAQRSSNASVGGLGGCPFAPRATGNIATEDLVYLLEGEGVETGVDLDGLVAVAEWLEGVLGRELPGQVYRGGGFPAVTAS